MQKILHSILFVCILTLSFVLTGCSYLNANVDELLRAPLLDGGYSDLQTTITNTFGKNAHLEYPTKGDLLSPFLFGDWDGDGIQDAAVFFTLPDIPKVQLALLAKNTDDIWEIKDVSALLTDTVEQVQTISLQTKNKNEILITHNLQGQGYMSVYTYENSAIHKVTETPYSQFLIEDFTFDGHDDLVLVLEPGSNILLADSSSTAQNSTSSVATTTDTSTITTAQKDLQVLLLTYNENNFVQTAVTGLNSQQFTGYANIAVSYHSSGKVHLVLDGWTSNANDHLASSILTYNEETMQFEPATLLGTLDLYADSQRYIRTLVSRDLDGDGIIEIPIQTNNEETGFLNYAQHKQVSFVRWMDFTKPYPQKSFGIYDDEYGFYMELPWELEGDLLLIDGEISGTIELRNLAGDILYATIIVGTRAPSLAWQKVDSVNSQNIYIKFGEDTLSNPVYDFLTIDRFEDSIHFFDE